MLGSISLTAARISFIVSMSWMAMRSKRKPSMWYSFIQYFTLSIMNLRIIGISDAVSLPQPEPSLYLPSAVLR